MQLSKHHGLGNEFLIALVDQVPGNATVLARAWCSRKNGIGADGLIFGTPSRTADLAMTLFNADGSVAEMSGNGIRCLAQACTRRSGVEDAELMIETAGGRRMLEVRMTSDPDIVQVVVDMGTVGPGPGIPDAASFAQPNFDVLRAGTGDVGNPHVVLEVDDLTAVDATRDGPTIEMAWSPMGINVHFMRQTGTGEITLLHWERGAGETRACGSGATVAAAIAHRFGLVGDVVLVRMQGGTAEIRLGETATLIGPAAHVADLEASP